MNTKDNNSEYKWVPEQPVDSFWQAPNFNFPSPGRTSPPVYTPPIAEPPVSNNAYRPAVKRRPTRPPTAEFRPAYPANPGVSRPNTHRVPAKQYSNRAFPPAQRKPYYVPDIGASAYYMPGYTPNRNNRWNKNKFWGRSGPDSWMNPAKRNWENSWDDMINTPGRTGEMPGGWTAPEVTVPNPVDTGDQMQDNVKDLPDQVRDMNADN